MLSWTLAPLILFNTSEVVLSGVLFIVSADIPSETLVLFFWTDNNEATDWLDALSTGITEGFLSDEGAKNVLIGGLSGAIMMGKSKFQEGRETSKNTAEAITQFSKSQLSDFTK